MKESDTKKEEAGIQKAVELMRKGATMLNEACPECSGPLFQLPESHDIICPHCEKKVLIVSDEAEVQELEKESLLTELDQAICIQIENVIRRLKEEIDADELMTIGRLTILWLEILEKTKHIRS
ncbi:MAG: Sjogren's syndrome/scleroderma autoantigen 1 family protein [Promethearchaeota archaeon]